MQLGVQAHRQISPSLPPNIVYTKNSFLLATDLKRCIINEKIGVRAGEMGVCVLRTGLNHSIPSF